MEENKTMTAAERAKLANQREAEAQRRKYAAQNPQRTATPVRNVGQMTPKTVKRTAIDTQKQNTREYPKAPYVKQAQPQKRNPVRKPETSPEKEMPSGDTGEYPAYVRAGKGGYRPRPKKNPPRRHTTRKLDSKFKAALLAAGSVLLIIIILLIAGVRYNTYKLTNGGEIRFFGIVKDGQPTSGFVSSSNGESGRFKTGEIKYSDGSEYKGDTFNAMRNGEGVLTYKNGTVYYGTFVENMLNGKGSVEYSNGDTYEGYFVNGKKHGQGTITYKGKNGSDIYSGQFENDKRHGKGYMTYSGGGSYDGYWENDLKHGEGIFIYSNGKKFEGTYNQNLREYGKFTFENGAVFEGTFEMNTTNQMLEGKYTYSTGTTVTGRYDKATNSFIAE